MSDLPALITAMTGAAGVLGGGITWVWRWAAKRFEQHERKLDECRDRETRAKLREAGMLTVIELMWQEITRLSPGPNAVLSRGRKLLRELRTAYPLDHSEPAWLAQLLAKLDEKED